MAEAVLSSYYGTLNFAHAHRYTKQMPKIWDAFSCNSSVVITRWCLFASFTWKSGDEAVGTALLLAIFVCLYQQNLFWYHQDLHIPNRSNLDQSHRYGRHQTACREPPGSYDKTTRTAICFEHKTQYLLIHAPYTRIVVFWYISNMISQSQISCNTPKFYIAAIFVRYYYTTDSWLL